LGITPADVEAALGNAPKAQAQDIGFLVARRFRTNCSLPRPCQHDLVEL